MKVALLCPGPSLALFPGRQGYDLLIAVNRAGTLHECDYWVAIDHYTYSLGTPLGRPIIVNPPDQFANMRRVFEAEGRSYEHLSTRDIPKPSCRTPWKNTSSLVGLVLAAHVGALTIDCFGVDMIGERDWDGFSHPRQRRKAVRWQRERTRWSQLVEHLATEGVKVTRISDFAEASTDKQEAAHVCG